jgi:hypothetical protein
VEDASDGEDRTAVWTRGSRRLHGGNRQGAGGTAVGRATGGDGWGALSTGGHGDKARWRWQHAGRRVEVGGPPPTAPRHVRVDPPIGPCASLSGTTSWRGRGARFRRPPTALAACRGRRGRSARPRRRRRQDQEVRRRNAVELTDAGRDTVQRAVAAVERAERDFLGRCRPSRPRSSRRSCTRSLAALKSRAAGVSSALAGELVHCLCMTMSTS